MSHHDDNLYTILGKLAALQPAQETSKEAAKKIYESVEAQGSILQGVDAVQAKLAKQFAESNTNEAVRVMGNTKGPVGHYSQMKYADKDGTPDSQAHRKGTADMAKSARAAGSKLPFNKTTEPTGKLASGGYNAMTKGVTPVKMAEGHCSKCDCKPCECPTNESICNECGMYESKCGCDHTMRESDDDKYTKILDACAAIYRVQYDGGDEIWDSDWMGDWAHSIEQANPTDKELDFIIAKGKMPKRLADVEFNTGDDFQFGESEIIRTPGKTVHRKTDFPGYPVDDNDDIEDTNKGKRGRPRKHAIKAVKTDAEGNKLGRGRPKKDAAPVYSKMNDPFGRVPAKPPKVKGPVVRHTMDEAMAMMSTRLQRITEGVNFANLLKEKHQTIDEMLAELSRDMKVFKDTGHCSELLRDCMEIKGYHGKMVADEAANPTNPFYKKQNDYDLPPSMRGHGTADYKLPDIKAHDNRNRDDYRDRAGLPPVNDSLANELNELARLAGLGEVSRGEYIKQQDTAAEKSGKDKFQAFGQEFDTDEISEEPNEGNLFTKGLEDDDVEIGDTIPGTNAVKTKDIGESDVDVEDAPDAVNKPRPKYGTIKQITSQGDDLNRQKKQDPHTANRAANPLTNVGTLESKLAAEYESIKKVSK
jgi:hypothetical protein